MCLCVGQMYVCHMENCIDAIHDEAALLMNGCSDDDLFPIMTKSGRQVPVTPTSTSCSFSSTSSTSTPNLTKSPLSITEKKIQFIDASTQTDVLEEDKVPQTTTHKQLCIKLYSTST